MSMNPFTENKMMVASLLGVDEDNAAELLQAKVIVRVADTGRAMADELIDQLQRTLTVTDKVQEADVEIVIGIPPTDQVNKTIYLSYDNDTMRVSDDPVEFRGPFPTLHGLKIVFAACYAASYVLARAIPGLPRHEGEFKLHFAAIGATDDILTKMLSIYDTALAGAGAVGNGFLRALRHMEVDGELDVTDPKDIGAGNANRCLYFQPGETGPKAKVLCTNAQDDFPQLALRPFAGRFDALRKERGRIRRVVVATDSRPARRSIQNDLPLEVVDASTTDVSEVIVHSHSQPTSGACLACIYKHVIDEQARSRDIASGLGLQVEDVDPAGLVNERVADLIVRAHPDLRREDLVGKAFDTLFKQLCGQQALLMPGGKQVLAPFAFVSNLAGAYLALELARLLAGVRGTNYMFLDPWLPPHSRLRSFRRKEEGCGFCSDPEAAETMKAVWPEAF